MAEKCTNTSSPLDRWMNPYPLAPLNHFTTPCSFIYLLLLRLAHWGNLIPTFPSFVAAGSVSARRNHPRNGASRRRASIKALWQLDSSLDWGCAFQTPKLHCYGLPEILQRTACLRHAVLKLWQ